MNKTLPETDRRTNSERRKAWAKTWHRVGRQVLRVETRVEHERRKNPPYEAHYGH